MSNDYFDYRNYLHDPSDNELSSVQLHPQRIRNFENVK